MRYVLAIVVILGTMNGATTARAQGDVAQQFVGTWRLISYTQRLADGTTRQGPTSEGFIIYTDTDYMCSVSMDPGRPKWQLSSPFGVTTNGSEALSAIRGSDGYCSRVEVHANEGVVLHHVEAAVRPNLVGVTRKRSFVFEGPNRVALSIDASELTPPVVDGTLIWERVVK